MIILTWRVSRRDLKLESLPIRFKTRPKMTDEVKLCDVCRLKKALWRVSEDAPQPRNASMCDECLAEKKKQSFGSAHVKFRCDRLDGEVPIAQEEPLYRPRISGQLCDFCHEWNAIWKVVNAPNNDMLSKKVSGIWDKVRLVCGKCRKVIEEVNGLAVVEFEPTVPPDEPLNPPNPNIRMFVR